MPERLSGSREKRFQSQDDVLRILAKGSDMEMEELYWYTVRFIDGTATREQLACARAFARQRARLIEQSNADVVERARTRPEPDDSEALAGIYREVLEAPVRVAVFRLWEKGYVTYASGFSGAVCQEILFRYPVSTLADYELPVRLIEVFKKFDAEVRVGPDRVGFRFGLHRHASDEELGLLWLSLVEALPDTDPPVLPRPVTDPVCFRDSQLRYARRWT